MFHGMGYELDVNFLAHLRFYITGNTSHLAAKL